ncbi:MAG: PKD repeat protein [Flavobacteriaceae bacterium]|jgi:PKD repeat protein
MKNTFILSMALLLSFFGTSQVVCNADFTSTTGGLSANFTNTSSGTTFYFWDFGDGNTSTATNPTHVYASNGTYLVCLTASYNDSITSCSDSACYNVTIMDSSGSACDADFTSMTSGNSATFTNTSSGTTNYFWDFGDGNTSSLANPTHAYASSGTYLVCLTASYNDSITSCSDSVCYDVTVMDSFPGCNASFTVTSGIGYASFTNTSTGSSLFHYWTFGDGANSYDVNPTHFYSTTGTYLVCLTITDSLTSCTSTACDSIYISVDSTTASIGTNELSNFTLFPNPAKDVINISSQSSSNGTVQVMDLMGRKMTEAVYTKTSIAIDISTFPRGVYLVSIIDETGQISSPKKFIRE